MRYRNNVLLIAALIFVSSMAFAADSVKGTLTIGNKVIELKSIYIEYVEDPNSEDGKQVIMLRLADQLLKDTRKSVLREQAEAGKLNLVELIIGHDKKITTVLILSKELQEGEYYSPEIDKDPQKITISSDAIKGSIARKGQETPGKKLEVIADIEVALPAEE